jgi:hypothetical protein
MTIKLTEYWPHCDHTSYNFTNRTETLMFSIIGEQNLLISSLCLLLIHKLWLNERFGKEQIAFGCRTIGQNVFNGCLVCQGMVLSVDLGSSVSNHLKFALFLRSGISFFMKSS